MPRKKIERAKIYRRLLTLIYEARAGHGHASHVGSSLSCLDILIQTLVYELKKTDYFIFSKGHAAPALYTVLNYLKVISNSDLKTYLAEGSKLPAHPPAKHFQNAIHFPTGSLGHGLSLSAGLSHSLKLQQKSGFVYCLMSDGELNEGQVWEAAQYASHFKLNNLIALVDKNGWQALGRTSEVLGEAASQERWSSFGWQVYETSGHDLTQLHHCLSQARLSKETKPKMILCRTVKGYCVSFMEDKLEWHYLPLSEKEYRQALSDVAKL